MKQVIPLLILALSVTAKSTIAQNTQAPMALSLKDCVDYALKNSATAKNARLDIALQKAQNAEVTGSALPQLSAQGKYQHYTDPMKSVLPATFVGGPASSTVVIPFSVKHNASLTASGSQMLFNGSIFVALQARNSLMMLAEQGAAMKEQDIRASIQKAYMALIIAHKQYDVMKSSMALLRDGNADMLATYKEGLIEKLDLDRNTVQLNNLESDSITAATGIELTEQMLKYNMGLALNTPINLIDTELVYETAVAERLLLQELPYENRLSYNFLATTLKLQKYDLKRYQFEGLPKLSLIGNAGYNYASNEFSDVLKAKYLTSAFWMLQMDIPIFDGWQRRSRVKAAKLKVVKAMNDLDNAKLTIDYQTNASKSALVSALNTLHSRERTMELATSVFDLTNRKYKAGVGTSQELILAQTDWLNAQNNYFMALQTVANAQADLQSALGLFK